MSDPVIRVENLGKKYIIGHQSKERYTALRDVIVNQVKSLGNLVNPKAKIADIKRVVINNSDCAELFFRIKVNVVVY